MSSRFNRFYRVAGSASRRQAIGIVWRTVESRFESRSELVRSEVGGELNTKKVQVPISAKIVRASILSTGAASVASDSNAPSRVLLETAMGPESGRQLTLPPPVAGTGSSDDDENVRLDLTRSHGRKAMPL